MGTNYYMIKGEWLPEVSDLGHPLYGLIRDGSGRPASIHIGKSSGSWCFSLRVYPDHGVHNLADWKALVERLLADGWRIESEYCDTVDVNVLWEVVERVGWKELATKYPFRRHEVDNTYCIGNGEGLYDYIVGEFS
jgi:hypothetical protein